MKLVVYTCIPVEFCEDLYRRVRITIDGTRVTSVEDPAGDVHHSCSHRSTVHPNYRDLVRELDRARMNRTLRERPDGDEYHSSSSCEESKDDN
jgi:hypothetical protein